MLSCTMYVWLLCLTLCVVYETVRQRLNAVQAKVATDKFADDYSGRNVYNTN